MRKLSILVLIFFAAHLVNSQSIEVIKDEFPFYQGIINYENKKSEQLYSEIKKIIILNEIKFDSLTQIISKGNKNFSYSQTVSKNTVHVGGVMNYILTIDIKDNKIRYSIDVTDVKAGLVSMFPVLIDKKSKQYNIVATPILEEINKVKNKLVEELSLNLSKQSNW